MELVFDAMARAVKCLIIGFRIFSVLAGRNAGLASLASKLVAELLAVVSLVSHSGGVFESGGQGGSNRMIIHISRCHDHWCGEAAKRIDHHVDFGIKAPSGFPNGLSITGFRAIGMLVNLAVGAVKVCGFTLLAADQPVMEKVKKSRERKPVEKLIYGKPVSKDRGERAPCAAVAANVPESIKVAIQVGPPTACMHNVVVSRAPLVDLIF